MNRYLKLVHMEIHRFRYVLGALMALTAIIQISALMITLSTELSKRELRISNYPEFLKFSWAISSTQFWFTVPISISIAVLALYVFIIWYRDWVARDTFIYRLLMLPTARRHIYLAKITAIILFIFGLLSYQLILLGVEKLIFNLIVPSEMRVSSYLTDAIISNEVLAILFPRNIEQFLYSYGMGIIAVFAIFTAILVERSYRFLGIVYGILYLLLCTFVISFPLLFLGLNNPSSYLNPMEIFAIELIMFGLVLVGSFLLGFRLLDKKITV